MDQFVWRSAAKAIAIVDMVFLCISFFARLVLVFVMARATTASSTFDNNQEIVVVEKTYMFPIWAIVIVIAVSSVISGIQIWNDCQLLRATEIERSRNDALGKVGVWRCIAVIFFVVNVIINFVLLSILGLFLTIPWGILSLIVTSKYIKELE